MRVPRIFQNESLKPGAKILLNEAASRHLMTVLRLEKGHKILLFNGDGHEYPAIISHQTKHQVEARVEHAVEKNVESPLNIHLGQGISKGDRMDLTIQKATELGVSVITPLFTTRSEVRLKGERLGKKVEHWQRVAISACEQSGRNHIPTIQEPTSIHEWIRENQEQHKITLDHRAEQSFKELKLSSSIALLIGPEGGLTFEEKLYAEEYNFTPVSMGPRILRTETAGIVAISLLQFLAGDL